MSLGPVGADAVGDQASSQVSGEPEEKKAADDSKRDKSSAGRSPTRIALDRLRADKIALVCAIIVILFVLIAIFAPLLCKIFGVELRGGDNVTDTDAFGMPTVGPPNYPFTWDHPMGLAPSTGHDNLAEWFYGARTSLLVAGISTLVATIIGVTIGLVAGFSRGVLDKLITFVIDVFLSLPFIMVALTLSPIIISRFRSNEALLDTVSLWALIAVLSLFGWMLLARLIRGEVLSLREREFVQAAQVIGVPTHRILIRELLPNLVAPIVVSISLGLPAFVTAEAGLAYLGIGVVGTPSWGQTIDKATGFYGDYPLYLWAPVLGILILVMALNLLGDAVRDAFDPKTRR